MNRFLNVLTAVLCFLIPGEMFGQAPSLGTAAGFVLYSSVGAVTNTGISHLTGNVGTNSGSSTGFGNVDGVMHDNDVASGAAGASLLIAYNQLAAAIPTFFPSSLLGNNDTLLPGVYSIPSAATLNGNLVLNAQGNPNAVFIFQIDGSFASSANAKVKIINGGVACNVFWKTEGMVDLGAGTTMIGTIVAHNSAINLNSLDTLEGRALALNGAITLNSLQAAMPLGCGAAILTGPLAPALLSTANYGIFSGVGPVTNTGITHVIGDVGTNSGLTTGFNPLFVTGMIHPVPDASTAACAADLTTVYNFLNVTPTDIELLYPAQFGNDLVLTPHTYLMAAATTFTGNLYLNAEGNSNAVFVIKITGALSTSTFSNVILINGAKSSNVYWMVDGAVDVNDNSVFKGNIIANNGAIHLRTGTTLFGRALTTNGAVTIDAMDVFSVSLPNADTITGPSNVCVGSSITLTDTASGGVWSATNGHATVLNGVVTGVTPGIDTINYIVTNTAGSDTAMHIVTVTAQPNAGTISGASTVCAGNVITLTDAAAGGVWSATNTRATVIGGVVTGVTSGIDTIRYTVTNTCGADTATKIITVNPQPNAGAISGASAVCVGNVITLTDAAVGGVWSATNTHAAVIGGVVTGVTSGIDTIRYTVTNTCGADTATKIVTVNPQPNAGAISGASTVCVGNVITLTDAAAGGVWSATNANATVIGGVVTGATSGIDTIRYTVTNTCGADTATKIVTVNPQPNAGAIAGASTVCVGNVITLTDAAAGGVWSATNTHAAVIGGVVTGVTSGIDTIRYTVTNTCGADTATKIVTVNPQPNAGTISGASTVCVGNVITLTDAAAGGVWSATNANATVIGGVVTGATSGIDTIRYTVTNTCGADTATKIVTVNPQPNAGAISGASTVCVGNVITLTDAAAGGVWSATNTRATVIGGVVTGVTSGIDTIRYTVTNTCGADTATKIVTVNPQPNAGAISGASTVCVGNVITLTDAAAGGVWSATNANATVIGGVVTGATSGIDTIRYTVTNTCGADTATKIVTVNPQPNAGTISGTSTVCVGDAVTLTDAAAGGVWSATNSNTTVTGGVVTGVTTGIDTIRYTVTNTCGADTATKIVTVNPQPNAGTISGTSTVCVGNAITLTDAAAGGVWSATNTNATVTGGVVTGVTSGIDTIRYIVTNTCGSDTATKLITVNTVPSAGTISGPSAVCTGTTIALTDATTGGVWTATNANATVAGGVVTGVTTGIDTIRYTVTNTCGADTATKIVTVNPQPNAGTISGLSNVCEGGTITLTATVTGGNWGRTNTNATVIGGVVNGVTAGIDTIMYMITNTCGTDTAFKIVTIDPLPALTSSTTPPAICDSAMFSYTPSSTVSGTLYAWTRAVVFGIANGAGSGATAINEQLYNVTATNKTATYAYTLTANGCTSVENVTVVVHPTPKLAVLTDSACTGVAFAYAPVGLTAGSTFTWTRNPVTGVTGGASSGIGGINETLTSSLTAPVVVNYAYTTTANTCSFTQNVAITLFPSISAPAITTQSPSAACTGTMYQNFGTSTPPQLNTEYNWSATNAQVWAQGANSQYAIVSFIHPGNAYVTLTAGIAGTACSSQSTVMVTVGTAVASVPTVSYFYNHFVCTPSDEASYQWGYDDATTLDSTILTGEINQDYVCVTPDYTNKFYWIMTSRDGCNQKTYYNAPTAVQNVNNEVVGISVYPNPANDLINVVISSTIHDQVQIDIVNMLGQKVTSALANDNKATIDVAPLAVGSYMVVCYRNGIKVAGSRFMKN
ncbi:hypothetical protein CJD36_012285 [Flavipsychrobacter stenotrophus]|uniref:Secretion system C-terminal sorting domain-containing protein n=1 Tax=Flavipsychrobacter stenotrophus TaxID=2077091 RepID=A0A2S7SUY1_9BACT|nr:ice-binding family protein [Flavipsychrobacter stenotrophus]PQJ10742.1 hypothetical protein CJD36_012285 [Flavipsychrobacter stenotrophus]